MIRTKIIATIGPASDSPEVLGSLMVDLCGAKVRVDRVEGDSFPITPGYVHLDPDGNRLGAVERRAAQMGDHGGRNVSHQAAAA